MVVIIKYLVCIYIFYIPNYIYIYIIKLYCHIQRALHDELECSLALTHIVPIYIYIYTLYIYIWQINISYRYKIYILYIICSLK